MTKNMGNADRIIRVIVGIGLLIAAFSSGWSTLWTVVAAFVGLAMLGTAVIGHCPPYALLGIKTCKTDNA